MIRLVYLILIVLLAISSMLVTDYGDAYSKRGINRTLIAKSVLSRGDTTRLQHVFAKAQRGENIVVGVIGGSVTAGSGVQTMKDRYGNIVYHWWKEKFPQSNIKFINAGINGSDSNSGAHRIQKDLLQYRPDFIISEFAVNDRNTKFAAETLEGLTRQTLNTSTRPALILLFMTYKDGHSAQEWHSQVGKYYGLPMISYGDAIKSAIKEGQLGWKAISTDIVHPNDSGHKYCAGFVISFLESVLSGMTGNSSLPEIGELPGPLISDTFEFTAGYKNNDIKYKINTGWAEFKSGWRASKPGSEIEFEVTGRAVSILYNQRSPDMGIVEVVVDDNNPVKLNGWFKGAWTRQQLDVVALNMDNGSHTLRIKVLNESNEYSTGYVFEIREIMVAGLLSEQRGND